MLRNAIFLEIGPPPPPRNANNIEHYTFVTLFSRKSDTPHPHLRYVTLEWPLINALCLIIPHDIHTCFLQGFPSFPIPPPTCLFSPSHTEGRVQGASFLVFLNNECIMIANEEGLNSKKNIKTVEI